MLLLADFSQLSSIAYSTVRRLFWWFLRFAMARAFQVGDRVAIAQTQLPGPVVQPSQRYLYWGIDTVGIAE